MVDTFLMAESVVCNLGLFVVKEKKFFFSVIFKDDILYNDKWILTGVDKMHLVIYGRIQIINENISTRLWLVYVLNLPDSLYSFSGKKNNNGIIKVRR